LVAACLPLLALVGCAVGSTAAVPAGVDRDELVATIIPRGQKSPPDFLAVNQEPPPVLDRVDKGFHVVVDALPGVLACAACVPVYALYILAHMHPA
jgi:hypothetical protein